MASFGRFTPSSGGVVETLSYTSPTLSLTQSAGTSPLTATIAGGGGVDGSGTANFVSRWTDTDTLGDSLYFSDDNIAKTIWDTTDKGLYFDFSANQYYIGDTDRGLFVDLDNSFFALGDNGYNNSTYFSISDGNQIIKTSSGGLDIGLILNFDNQSYLLGDNGINGTSFLVDVNLATIKTTQGGADKGLYLDFANNKYEIGLPNTKGLRIDIANFEYSLGDYTNENNGTLLIVDEGLEIIKTKYFNANKGLYIDFINNSYALGYTETGDFDTEPVLGFGYQFGNFTMGDPSSLLSDNNLTLDTGNSRLNINSDRTRLRNLTSTQMYDLSGNQIGDMIFNTTLSTICIWVQDNPESGATWWRLQRDIIL